MGHTVCRELEDDIWGIRYKIAVKKLIGYAPFNLAVEQKVSIANDLFRRKKKTWLKPQTKTVIETFKKEELKIVLENMKHDGIPTEAIKILEKIVPDIILDPLNNVLRTKKFPKEWKKARLVLIPKGKPEDMKFRPICLLNSISKVYEGLLRARLDRELEATGCLSENHFGFRKKKSTIQAVEKVVNIVKESKWAALITLDVRNAFNSASWDKILRKLEVRGIAGYLLEVIDSYLDERSIQIDKDVCLDVTAGVPQGSVLGPTLWNVLYNDVLEEQVPEGVSLIAYADDLAVVITARDKEQLNWKGSETLRHISAWMRRNELELAPHKSESVILRGQRGSEEVKFFCDEVEIPRRKSLVYLGSIGEGCKFGQHIKTAVHKAEKKVAALCRIMPNVRGPGSKKREMLYYVVQSILLYGAPIWHKYVRYRKYRELLTRTQRRMLRVTSAYRTVSARAVQVVSGTIPIDLLAEERGRLYSRMDGSSTEAKREERQITLRKWQELWDDTVNEAQWTKTLIPRLRDWIECNHRQTDYFLTEALTGHGCFRGYLKRMGKTESDLCLYCGKVDTAEHTLFECERWEQERHQLQVDIGIRLGAHNLVNTMMEEGKKWDQIHRPPNNLMHSE